MNFDLYKYIRPNKFFSCDILDSPYVANDIIYAIVHTGICYATVCGKVSCRNLYFTDMMTLQTSV